MFATPNANGATALFRAVALDATPTSCYEITAGTDP